MLGKSTVALGLFVFVWAGTARADDVYRFTLMGPDFEAQLPGALYDAPSFDNYLDNSDLIMNDTGFADLVAPVSPEVISNTGLSFSFYFANLPDRYPFELEVYTFGYPLQLGDNPSTSGTSQIGIVENPASSSAILNIVDLTASESPEPASALLVAPAIMWAVWRKSKSICSNSN